MFSVYYFQRVWAWAPDSSDGGGDAYLSEPEHKGPVGPPGKPNSLSLYRMMTSSVLIVCACPFFPCKVSIVRSSISSHNIETNTMRKPRPRPRYR